MSRSHWRLDPEVCYCRGNIISHMLLFRLMVLLFSRGNCETASNVHTQACTLLAYLNCKKLIGWLSGGASIHQCHMGTPPPSSVCSCGLMLWSIARGMGVTEVAKPASESLPFSAPLCVWGIYTNHRHKALIYLGYGALLAPASFYLSPLDETAQSRFSL